MIEIFYPEKYINSIYEIDFNKLQNERVEAIIFDIDNTLVPYFVPKADDKIKSFFLKLKKRGIKIGILSNNNKKRVSLFCKDLNIEYVHEAHKPLIGGLSRLMKKLDVNRKNTVLVGDQIFTDVLCGNRMGVHTILVKPVSQKDEFCTKLKRWIEAFVISLYLKRKKGVRQ